MNKKEIIILAAIGAGVYILSQVKAMKTHIAPQYAKTAPQKAAPKRIGQPTTWAAYIAAKRKAAVRKAAAQKIGKIIGKTVAQKVAQKVVQKVAQKPGKKISGKKVLENIITSISKRTGKTKTEVKEELARARERIRAKQKKAAVKKAAAQKIGKIIGKKVAQKVAPKRIGQPTTWAAYIAAKRKAAVRKVAPWKAPYKFPKSNFRVITPSDKLRNLAKKDIARKKAVQQKKVQKTTPSTPSARRKKRLEALYGSHWHDIWVQRQRR